MDLRVSRPSPSTLAVPETRRGSAKREIPWVLLSRGARSSGFWVWYLKRVPVLGTNALAHLAAPTSELISAGEVNSRLDRRLESQEPIQYKQTQSYKVTLRLQSKERKSKRAKEQPQSVRYPRLTICTE